MKLQRTLMPGIGLLLFILSIQLVSAQPANDDCTGALLIPISQSEEEVILVDGDTRGATASTIPYSVCSTTFYTDDVFFIFTTPSNIPVEGFVIKAYFNKVSNPNDVTGVGMALYSDCDSLTTPTHCFSSLPTETSDHLRIYGQCLLANHTYYLRVWSRGADPFDEGTFRIGIFHGNTFVPALWSETFNGGIEENGWTTFGECANVDSNANAGFKFLPDGLIDNGYFALAGWSINSLSYCDGAVGVDSDFNNGNPDHFGEIGPCESPGKHYLISPPIYSGSWDAGVISLEWIQAIRNLWSTYFISFRVRNTETTWTTWKDIPVNTEFVPNSGFNGGDIQRYLLRGAAGHDTLQIRFIYHDDYYLWAIDDVRIIETECANTRISPDFFAVAPFAIVPADQVYPFPALAQVENIGGCTQKDLVLTHTVQDINTKEIIYEEQVHYDSLNVLDTADLKVFPQLIDLPELPAIYKGTYTIAQDSSDQEPSDNTVEFSYAVGGNVFALEQEFTTAVTLSFEPYGIDPVSFAYGNYFRPVKDAAVNYITWGISNPQEMAGQKVNILLLEWNDHNGDEIAQFEERIRKGIFEYTFSGAEEENSLIHSVLENAIVPDQPIIMEGGKGYMAIVEYNATPFKDPHLYLLASDLRNYTVVQQAMDLAIETGLAEKPVYFSVLGTSPDGVISNIDYEVKELSPSDSRIFFGNHIVPVVRIAVSAIDTTSLQPSIPEVDEIYVNPNPTTGDIIVELDFQNYYQQIHFRLISSVGQTVYSKSTLPPSLEWKEKIDTGSFSSGNYVLQVIAGNGMRSLPVVILK